ncbi:2TM domain-containing protein [Zunongwangia sp. F260]|uniref:2TM domain-containing protein n=1 Tax=Autumnicola lenta TaxID=3075593 RepID=A0ABU3CLV0_9FLAO|nr:2TM domain-containing protein [Zunongwangia sp. F260]MDT0647324.1 2TM domain-containing protein [Zunongwangia sp. F260]
MMEKMEEHTKEDFNYKSAKKKVKDIKGFYIHLLLYILVNIVLFVLGNREEGVWESHRRYLELHHFFLWGIGLFIHWASVFGPNKLLGKNWEERKVKELMEKEKRRNWK